MTRPEAESFLGYATSGPKQEADSTRRFSTALDGEPCLPLLWKSPTGDPSESRFTG